MKSRRRFPDRRIAGRMLAERLAASCGGRPTDSVVVLGIPRGGVPVAAEVAAQLGVVLDVILVRKLGTPGQEELAMGAVGEERVKVINDDVVESLHLSSEVVDRAAEHEWDEIERRTRLFRSGGQSTDVRGRTVIIVDDGIATGSTAIAACRIARLRGASRIILAVPVMPAGWGRSNNDVADELVCVLESDDFESVGQFYENFDPVPDSDVIDILQQHTHPAIERTDFVIDVDGTELAGEIDVPVGAGALVFFAHGSGSGWTSPRNRGVADHLNRLGLATVLVSLTPRGDSVDEAGSDDGTDVLARRLWKVIEHFRQQERWSGVPVGIIGSSSGAAVALTVAADHPSRIAAVVARGGRPDLAEERLHEVACPVLLIVGSRDRMVLDLNERMSRLIPRCSLSRVAGASHLFEEPGTLKEAARLAGGFLRLHLG